MEWKLVNVTGIRPEPFTAELILDPEEAGGVGANYTPQLV